MPQPLVARIIVVETIARKKVQRADQGTNCIQGERTIKTETTASATTSKNPRRNLPERCKDGVQAINDTMDSRQGIHEALGSCQGISGKSGNDGRPREKGGKKRERGRAAEESEATEAMRMKVNRNNRSNNNKNDNKNEK